MLQTAKGFRFEISIQYEKGFVLEGNVSKEIGHCRSGPTIAEVCKNYCERVLDEGMYQKDSDDVPHRPPRFFNIITVIC